MRYLAKFTNGYWRLFDSEEYEEIDIFDRQVEADQAAAWMNANAAVRRASRC